MKQRIDVWLTQHGLAESREKAQAMIMAGEVYIGEKKVLKASEQAADDAPVHLRGGQTFASRGGHKLEKAITAFQADVRGLVAMDIGAAAGGSMACIASPVVQRVCSFINRISPSISPSSESSREQTAKRGFIFAGSVSELSRSTVQSPVTRRLPLPKGTLTKSPGRGDIPSGMR